MAMITRSVTDADRGQYVADELIARNNLLLRLKQFGTKRALPAKMGTTAKFIQYERADVMVSTLVEGVTPEASSFTVREQEVTVDQWGMYFILTDLVEITTKHPVLQESVKLLADSVARTQDYSMGETLNRGTNVQFWDGTRASVSAITATDYWNSQIAHMVRATFGRNGVPGREGDLYAAVIDTSVEADIFMDQQATGGYVAALQQQGMDKLEKGIIRDWLGFRWIRSNFLPVYTRLTTFTNVTTTTGGGLSGTVKYKITRKSMSRGFEEAISVEGSQVMGTDTRLVFTAPATLGYVYNIYVGAATGDSNLYLAYENLAAGASVNIDALVGSGLNPYQTPASGVSVHVIYFFAADAVDTVPLDGMSMEGAVSPRGVTKEDPLNQRMTVGSKYMDKDAIRDQTRIMRVYLACRIP